MLKTQKKENSQILINPKKKMKKKKIKKNKKKKIKKNKKKKKKKLT